MRKILRFRMGLIVVLTSILVAASYEFKAPGASLGIPPAVLAAVAVILGGPLSTMIADFLISYERFRRLIVGSCWIEGFWLYTTRSGGRDIQTPFLKPAVLAIRYAPDAHELKAVSFRLDDSGQIFMATSRFAYAKEEASSIDFLNYFEFKDYSPEKLGIKGRQYGVAHAQFETVRDRIQRFSGTLAVEKEGMIRAQLGVRIDEKEISELKKEAGSEDWIPLKLKKENARLKGYEGALVEKMPAKVG